MGQAFDRNGNVLGEASGETKREVFDKLQSEFANAHEIRIRSMQPDERVYDPPRVAPQRLKQIAPQTITDHYKVTRHSDDTICVITCKYCLRQFKAVDRAGRRNWIGPMTHTMKHVNETLYYAPERR